MTFDSKLWAKQSLPQEHGSWAFVIEPLAIAAIAGGAGFGLLGLGFFLAFLGYRPGLTGIKDLLKRKAYPRTWPSIAAGGSLIACGSAMMLLSREWSVLSAVVVFGGAFAVLDARGDKRSVERESFGALLAAPVACFAAPFAAPVIVIRPIISVLSVRGLIARWEDAALCRWLAVGLSAALVPMAAIAFGTDNWRFVAYCLCTARAAQSALLQGKNVKPMQIGIAEIAVSALVVVGWLLGTNR